MGTQNDKLKSTLARPLMARPAYRWSFSFVFVLVALFAIKPLIVNRLIARAEAYSSYGLYNNAARESEKAVLLDNGNTRAWNALGSAYKSQGDIDNAVNTYLNAINANPSNKIAHFRVAMIFAMEQRCNRAIPHFEHIRFLGPESPDTLAADPFSYYRSSLQMLSICYERVGKLDKVQSVLEDLAQTYPDYTKAVKKLQMYRQSSQAPKNP